MSSRERFLPRKRIMALPWVRDVKIVAEPSVAIKRDQMPNPPGPNAREKNTIHRYARSFRNGRGRLEKNTSRINFPGPSSRFKVGTLFGHNISTVLSAGTLNRPTAETFNFC